MAGRVVDVMSDTPDAAIEAAAEAIHARADGECFHSERGTVISCERDARAAIEAAMPALEQHFRETLLNELETDDGMVVRPWKIGMQRAVLILRGKVTRTEERPS